MNCARIRELLSDYLDSELSAAQMAGVQDHLKQCFGCEQEHQALRQTVHLIALHGRLPTPVDLRQSVLARLATDDRRNERRSARSLLPLWSGYPGTVAMVPRAAAAAAAILLALVGGRLLTMNRETPSGSPPPTHVVRITPRQDYTQLHGPYQFGQAMGRDDAIILASDMVGQ